MSKNKIFFLGLVIIAAGLYYSYRRSFLTPSPITIAELTPAGYATLEASPAPALPYLDETINLDINVKLATDSATAVELELLYDSSYLEITGISPSSKFPTQLVNPLFEDGRFTTTVGVEPDSDGVNDWATIGTISVKIKKVGETSILFGPDTRVAALGSSGNVLREVTSIVITGHYPGDINKDKSVDLFDFNIFLPHFGTNQTYSGADINKDGDIDIFDFNILVRNFGKSF